MGLFVTTIHALALLPFRLDVEAEVLSPMAAGSVFFAPACIERLFHLHSLIQRRDERFISLQLAAKRHYAGCIV